MIRTQVKYVSAACGQKVATGHIIVEFETFVLELLSGTCWLMEKQFYAKHWEMDFSGLSEILEIFRRLSLNYYSKPRSIGSKLLIKWLSGFVKMDRVCYQPNLTIFCEVTVLSKKLEHHNTQKWAHQEHFFLSGKINYLRIHLQICNWYHLKDNEGVQLFPWKN